MYKKTKHIHFVGIGGIGMSGIAELLLNLGYRVSGSDLKCSAITKRLEGLGGVVHYGHDSSALTNPDVVVTSSAIPSHNPEVLKANELHIPVIQRAEMLAELMRLKKYGIAIAGSHGKTSTTSLVSWILSKAKLDPTVVIGGKVDSLGGNAKLGSGEFLVAEADESDGSFLKLAPVIEVVTNIDLEHLDYYRDLDHIKEIFLQFIDKIPFYGAAILCLDDLNTAELLPNIRKRVITYGLSEQADIHAVAIQSQRCVTDYTARYRGEELGVIRLNSPGIHTVRNSLAAMAVGLELEIPFPVIAEALADFGGVQRRLQIKGVWDNILVIDDYGHHPTEIKATLQAVRDGWPERRIVVLFQPHRYSRTKALFEQFSTAFYRADVLFLTEIYAASEEPMEGISGENLAIAIRDHGQRNVHFYPSLEEINSQLLNFAEPGDLILTLGAGDIVQVGERFLEDKNNG
ncbi:MAG: UDP-N-acetylmuramate--L-alanine ligase [Desulfobulbaceae bacterium]|nr:UDP-N-acetylmuramate--L-alanine ligase [Desulfobulbaceae bacterium]